MVLNSYAILMAFAGMLRLLLGLLVAGLAVAAWWHGHRSEPADESTARQDRMYLAFLLALLLILFNLLSWPLFYLLLQSYVPQWSGIMCIYGVMQIGEGSTGSARFLPRLLAFLQGSNPALLFLGGAWFVIYLLNRQTATGALVRRLGMLLVPLGGLAAVDAAAELTYIAIPKKDEVAWSGCCTGTFGAQGASWQTNAVSLGRATPRALGAAYFGSNLGLVLALVAATRRGRRPPGDVGLVVLVCGGLIVLTISGLFLVDVAAPMLLKLPYHRCPYDLIAQVPEAVVASALFLSGCFALGWAGVARWLGRCAETEKLVPGMVRGLLQLGLWCFTASLIMMALELVLA